MTLYHIVLLIIILIFSGICTYQDIKTMKIKDYPLWGACYASIICHMIFNRETLWIYILSGMISGLFYFVVRMISGKKLGTGDVYFGFFQGFCLPVVLIPVCILIEVFTGLLFGLIRKSKNDLRAFPFIPFMSVGLVISYLVSNFVAI